jgi:hypothetical protein
MAHRSSTWVAVGVVPAAPVALHRVQVQVLLQVQAPVLRRVRVLGLVLLVAPALQVHQRVPLLQFPAIAPLQLPGAPAVLPALVPGAVALLVVQPLVQLPPMPTQHPLQAMPTSRNGAKRTS